MNLKIYPYKMTSESASELAAALGCKRIFPNGNYRPRSNTTVINWGSSAIHFTHNKIINKASAVAKASNKLLAFIAMKAAGVSTVDFTTEERTVRDWLNDNHKVVVRHKLSANSGDGIAIIRPDDESRKVPYAKLYTKYKKKDREFRIHVFKEQVFDFQEKKKRNGYTFDEHSNASLVRSHLNGWIFCRLGVVCPTSIKSEAIKAIKSLGLDFGAVDVIQGMDGKPYVLEVNTAPGMESSTLQNYVTQFETLRRRNVSRW